MGFVALSRDVNTGNGCDRVIVASDDRIIVQGATVLGDRECASVWVPAGETLTAISARILLDAARELERRMRL